MDTVVSQAGSRVPYLEMIDLAGEKVGGAVLYATDDFFAPKENMLKPSTPIFIHDKYTEFGKWMDGWESRRKRVAGHDHAIIRLGIPGEIHGVDIDTSFFTGNYPEYASLEAIELSKDASVDELHKANWTPILVKSSLQGGTHNYFPISSRARWTHLRFHIYPDGGVARFRVYGKVKPPAEKLKGVIDLAAAENGAQVVTANDMYFGPKDNLILPGRAKTMGEGWETRRKRGPGNDWIIVKLCGTGKISKIEVDTNHFKGNYPDRCSIDILKGRSDEMLPCDFRDSKNLEWISILPETKLQAHTQHFFEKELKVTEACTYLRLNIFPDGGISRLRVWGTLS